MRAALVLLAAGLAAGLLPAAGTAQSPVAFVRGDVAGLVGIGEGRRMYLECHGRGRPTVVLDAGLRSRGDYWIERTEQTRGHTVVPAVARFARVCIYDRPGTTLGTDQFSRSDPVAMPRTARDAVRDLHALLRAARVPGPYVLVGHSTGGLISRLYAATYPREVAGMVLVDALSEFIEGSLTPAQTAAYDALNNGPLPGLEGYTALERIGFVPSFRQMRRAPRLRPMPLTVISRRLPVELPDGLPAGLTTAVVERAWSASQDKLAALLPRARHVVARRSSHYVMFSQPRLIARAIRRIVERR